MKKIVIVLLLLASCFSSFAKASINKKKKKAKKEITSVLVYHTACFGRCPEYKIEVNKSGIATYTGIRFVPDSGVYTKKIGTKLAKEILSPFTTYLIDTFPNRYESLIQDLPGVELTVYYPGSTKNISNAHFGPPLLGRLRAKLDSILMRKMDETGLLPLDNTWHKVTGGRK